MASIKFLSYDGMVDASPILRANVTLNILCNVMTLGEILMMDGGLAVVPSRYMYLI
jgi:hypothetical protein